MGTDYEDFKATWKHTVSDKVSHTSLLEHAQAMAALLRSEWEAEGSVRSWHARYTKPEGVMVHCIIAQQRGQPGFTVRLIHYGLMDVMQSVGGIPVTAAAVWLGLDGVPMPLEWRHEL